MTQDSPLDGVQQFYETVQALQATVMQDEKETLLQVAAQMAAVVEKGGRIFLFGTGHSHILLEESFYRAGGLAATVPIYVTNLMLHEHPNLSGRMERIAALAAPLLDEYQPEAGEMLFVISNSGVNALPVEMAMEARRRGVIVVAICSRAYAEIAPLAEQGKRLPEVADYVIDNHGQPGDAIMAVEGSAWRTGSTSTIIGAMLWNCLLSETVRLLQQSMDDPPIFASMNMKGAAEHNAQIFETWAGKNPHL